MKEFKEWDGFEGKIWKEEINTRDFIQKNYTPYEGDESFLAGPTDATNQLWGELQKLQKEERANNGVLDMETEVVSSLTAYGPGYIKEELKDLEKIVGLQTDKPLKRAFMPYGGIKMAEQACTTYGYTPNPKFNKIFNEYHKTHNAAVFDAYTPEMKKARHSHIVTGLPDTYGRGRIVGDYRRVALYGIDFLIEQKQKDKANCGCGTMTDDVIRLREEIAEQIKALQGMKEMAQIYGYDISRPAKDAKEAVQWLYFGYLAAIKTQNGAAMSVGRISTFLDIYIERDLKKGILTETEAQELIDHMTMKFRMVKFARIPSYNQLFSGDPVWATLEVAGIGMDGRSMVTKNDFRFLHTLENMGPSPEPNLTVLYSSDLPETFKKYASDISIRTSSIQYENDDVMKPVWGDDYSICLKSYYNTIFITNCLNFCVLNCTQRVNYMRESCDTGCECTAYIGINKSHLSSFVVIFIMHILNQVQNIYIQTCQPVKHAVITFHNLIIVKVFGRNRFVGRSDLIKFFFVHTTIDCVQQCFCKVCSCSEELHFLTCLCS